MKGVVNFAIEDSLRKIETERDVIDALRDFVGSGVFGHQLTSALKSVGQEVLGAEEYVVAHSDCAWSAMTVCVRRARLIGALDGGDSRLLSIVEAG